MCTVRACVCTSVSTRHALNFADVLWVAKMVLAAPGGKQKGRPVRARQGAERYHYVSRRKAATIDPSTAASSTRHRCSVLPVVRPRLCVSVRLAIWRYSVSRVCLCSLVTVRRRRVDGSWARFVLFPGCLELAALVGRIFDTHASCRHTTHRRKPGARDCQFGFAWIRSYRWRLGWRWSSWAGMEFESELWLGGLMERVSSDLSNA